ncbi:MAG: polysaccharide biosynthesis C-terminal domain-containing protein, partial [Lachnospiraceae bacterium]|nr:polysaccharide biosynthesis C-terminal domain-containing protein [Lachnospiraceae bacterium]
MLHGPLAMKLILFALPLALSSILQQLFNSADVAVVGRYAGSDALAAVGANVANVGVFVNLMVGASAGPNIVIANMIGTGKRDEVSKAVHTIMTMAILGGLLLMGIGMAIARPLLLSTNTPAGILGAAELYLRVYLIGIPFILIYNFGSAILRSIGDTKRPLYVMLISGAINVGLNLLFVIGFDMEVLGVAVATVISNVLSAGMIILILIREQGMIHLDLRKLQLNRLYAGRVIRFAIPSGIQGMVFSVSNIFVQSGINVFGEDAIAGSSAA